MNGVERSSGVPTDEELDEMAQLITRCDFAEVAQPEHRAIIMDLTIKANQAGDVADIGLWFRKSKLWEGMP